MPRRDGAAGVAVLGGTVVGGTVERRQDPPPGVDSGSTWRGGGAGVVVVGAGSTVAVSLAGGLFALAVPCPVIQAVRTRHAPALATPVTRRARRAG